MAHSTNGYGLFNYAYDTDGLVYEEPEGLVFWDLDGSPAPGISGQMHVFMLNNDLTDSDNIYLKHYTHRIWVNHAAGPPGDGTLAAPFPTVGQAVALVWGGSEIRIAGGSYNETVTISTKTRVVSAGGVARIGGP